MAEDLVGRLNELRERVIQMEETVGETNERLADLERTHTEQRALLEAMAEQQNIQVEEVIANVEGPTADDADPESVEESDTRRSTTVTETADENA